MADAPSDWPQFARALRKQALMEEMMEMQGVDLLAAVRAGDGFVKARANCRDCKDEAACRAWFLERSGVRNRRDNQPTASRRSARTTVTG